MLLLVLEHICWFFMRKSVEYLWESFWGFFFVCVARKIVLFQYYTHRRHGNIYVLPANVRFRIYFSSLTLCCFVLRRLRARHQHPESLATVWWTCVNAPKSNVMNKLFTQCSAYVQIQFK